MPALIELKGIRRDFPSGDETLGALALALNDLVCALDAGPVSGEPEIRALVTRCDRLHRKAARELARERRG